MPLCPSGTVRAVSREVVVFVAAADSEVTTVPGGRLGFYEEVRTAEVARATSGGQGFFEFDLPVGKYSVFVVENSQYMAVRYGGRDSVSVISVETGVAQEVHVDITYRSSS